MLEFVFDLHAKAMTLVPSLKFDKRQEIQRVLISLYATILEQSESVAILLKAGKVGGTDAILRSLLEAWVDLSALLKDEKYLDNMNAAYHKEWKKLIEEGIAGDNAFLAGFGDNDVVVESLNSHRKSFEEYRAAGIHPLSAFERFGKADMVDEYRSVYNLLCSESHNNIRSLMNRHMRVRDNDIELVLNNFTGDGECEVTLDSVAGILMNSSLAMHHRFLSGQPNGFAEMDKRLAELRKARDG
ncbi:DUF5677 domain-containing protein [Candidatus Phyllobacterium onerii]|jgi:hypothetical protein|uniref:DUF5677 domain-containing protein n=1 Tax=Candidatus Phyllobacterium onerii TaxID=3020828 RepID=UPI00233072BB|nr:DUF5677 domain-containing protein [Phyllobacterium sp. IY22]